MKPVSSGSPSENALSGNNFGFFSQGGAKARSFGLQEAVDCSVDSVARIREHWTQRAEERRETATDLVVGIPLLYETGAVPLFDHIVAIGRKPGEPSLRTRPNPPQSSTALRRRELSLLTKSNGVFGIETP